MGFFDKKNKVEAGDKTNIDCFKEFRVIGETFNYLGRICVVIGYHEFVVGVGFVPALTFDYADKNGVIRSMSADKNSLRAIIFQNKKDKDMGLPEITEEDRQLLYYNPNTNDIVDWVEDYARKVVEKCITAIEESQPPDTTPWDCVDSIRKKLEI